VRKIAGPRDDTAAPRGRAARRADTLARLARDVDCWVASADGSGLACLVPLSFAWDGARLVLATASASRTARNLRASGRAHLALGTLRDVVAIEGTVEVVDRAAIAPALADAFAGRAGWEPRDQPADYVYLLVTPRRIQAWRESNEQADKTIMRDGEWL
jgi:general stress protein 26